MHELEASSGASQVQAAELAGLRDRVTTLTTQLKVGKPLLCHILGSYKLCAHEKEPSCRIQVFVTTPVLGTVNDSQPVV